MLFSLSGNIVQRRENSEDHEKDLDDKTLKNKYSLLDVPRKPPLYITPFHRNLLGSFQGLHQECS